MQTRSLDATAASALLKRLTTTIGATAATMIICVAFVLSGATGTRAQEDAYRTASYTPAQENLFVRPAGAKRRSPPARGISKAGGKGAAAAAAPETASSPSTTSPPPPPPPATTPVHTPAAPAVQNLTPPYLSGEAKVKVEGNQNPLIRLGLAQNGVTMIEFPASDRFFAIHSGNSDLVTVEKSPTMGTDHYLVLRAGSGFIVPPPPSLTPSGSSGSSGGTARPKMTRDQNGRWVRIRPAVQRRAREEAPATSIIVQMRSGMVMTLMIYPVAQLSAAAHRCVISYDRAAAVAARQAAGLAVNLKEDEPPGSDKPSTTTAALMSTAATTTSSSAPGGDGAATTTSAAKLVEVSALPPPPPPPSPSPASTKRTDESADETPAAEKGARFVRAKYEAPDPATQAIVEVAYYGHSQQQQQQQSRRSLYANGGGAPVTAEGVARAALLAAVKEPKRFKRWPSPVHGLSLSTLPASDAGDEMRLVVVAVRNTTGAALRVLPGAPELFVETLDKNERPVQVERLAKLHTESTTTNRVLPGGAVVFYAVVFEPPILGAKQHLRLAIGQTEAADEPAAANLSANRSR